MLNVSLNKTFLSPSPWLFHNYVVHLQEIDSIKCENGRLKHDLRSKESEWIERREALVSQKDAERRQGVKDVQDQCQQDYQRFISDHQDVLNRALKEARDKHEMEKVGVFVISVAHMKAIECASQVRSGQDRSECLTCTFRASCCSACRDKKKRRGE